MQLKNMILLCCAFAHISCASGMQFAPTPKTTAQRKAKELQREKARYFKQMTLKEYDEQFGEHEKKADQVLAQRRSKKK